MTHEEVLYIFAKGFIVASLAGVIRWAWNKWQRSIPDSKP